MVFVFANENYLRNVLLTYLQTCQSLMSSLSFNPVIRPFDYVIHPFDYVVHPFDYVLLCFLTSFPCIS